MSRDLEISFASNNARATMPGVPVDANALSAPYTALAKGAAAVGGGLADLAKIAMKKDAAAIVADTLTSVHEDTNRDYLEAQRNSRTNTGDPDGSGNVSAIDTIVRFPEEAGVNPDLNGKTFSQYVLGSYDQRTKDRLSKIKNPIAQQELRNKFTTLRNQLAGQALDFEARTILDTRKVMVGQAADRMGRLVLDNPMLYDSQVALLQQSIDGAGLGADTAVVKDKMANQLAVSAAKGWIEVDPLKAKELLSSDAASFRRNLSPDQVAALKSQAESAFDQKMAQARQTLSMEEASHKQSLLETGEGIPGYEAQLKRAYADNPEVLKSKLEEYDIMRGAYTHKTAMDGMPLSKLADYARGQRPPAGDTQYANKSKVSDFLEKYAAEQMKLAQEDPGLLVEQLNQKKFDEIQDTRQRALLRLALEEQKGIPEERRRMLANAERDGIIQTIQSAQPNEVLSVIQRFTQEYDAGNPNEQGLSDHFYRELTVKKDGLAPVYNVLLQNVRDGSPVAFDLVRSLTLSDELKKYKPAEADQKKLYEKVDKQMKDWSQGFLYGTAENLPQVNEMRQVVADLAKLYVVDQRMDEGAAVDKATRKLITDKLAVSNGTLQIPRVIYDQGKRVPAVARTIQANLRDAKFSILKGEIPFDIERTFGGAPDFIDAKTRKEIIGTALKRGYWKTNADYSGAYFMVPLVNGDLPILDKNGGPFSISFADAQNRSGKIKSSKKNPYDAVPRVDMFVEPQG